MKKFTPAALAIAKQPLLMHQIAVTKTANNAAHVVLAGLANCTSHTIDELVWSGLLLPYCAAVQTRLEKALQALGPLSTEPSETSTQGKFERMARALGMQTGMFSIGQADPRQYANWTVNGMWRFQVLQQEYTKSMHPIAILGEAADVSFAVEHYLELESVELILRKGGDSGPSGIFMYEVG